MKSPKVEPQKQPNYPELELSVLIRVMKNRGIFLEPVPNKTYYIRFRELATGRTIQGMTHARGSMINPRFLAQILERFQIELPDFLEELAIVPVKKGPQRL